MKRIGLVFLFLFVNTLLASTWTGALSSNVSDKHNWNNNHAPSNNTTLTMENSLNTQIFFDWPNATDRIRGINFNSNSSSYTFSSSNNQCLELGNIYNNSYEEQTFNINLSFNGNSNIRTNGILILNGIVDVRGNHRLNLDGQGKIELGSNASLNSDTKLKLINGIDLDLGGTSQSITSLDITGNSIIDFSGSSSLYISNLFIQDGAMLFITNWSNLNSFYVDSLDQPTISRIQFVGYGQAHWNQYGHNLCPIPEPSTYGAIFIGLFSIAFLSKKILTK